MSKEKEKVMSLKIETFSNSSYKVTNLDPPIKGSCYTVYPGTSQMYKLKELMGGKKILHFTIDSHPELYAYLDEIEKPLDDQWKKCTVQGRKELGLKPL